MIVQPAVATNPVEEVHTLFDMFAGENVSSRFVVPTVASAIDLVVHLDILAEGRRRVREIVGLSGRVEEEIIEVTDVFSLRGDRLVRGEGHPPVAERFARAGHEFAVLLGGRSAA